MKPNPLRITQMLSLSRETTSRNQNSLGLLTRRCEYNFSPHVSLRTKPPEVQDSLQGLKIGKVPSLKGIPNMTLLCSHSCVLHCYVINSIFRIVYCVSNQHGKPHVRFPSRNQRKIRQFLFLTNHESDRQN